MKVSKTISIELKVLKQIDDEIEHGKSNSVSEFIQKAVKEYLKEL